MIRKLLFSLLLGICLLSHTGESATLAERRALSVPNYKVKNRADLTQFLIRDFDSQQEKAMAIAVWIASHIKYDSYTLAADIKNSGYKVRSGLQANPQSAEDVFNMGMATCAGYADLYEKMLETAHIKSEKVHGFVITNISNFNEAKKQLKKENIGHVWNKVYIDGGKFILVDITFMASGRAGNDHHTLSENMKRKEIRKTKKFKSTYPYNLEYFGFDYGNLQKQGEYRFSYQRKVYK